jgi:hypothetical protein
LELVSVFLAAIGVMTLLMFAANAIPNAPIAEHVKTSMPPTNKEMSPLNWGRLDVFTECTAATSGLMMGAPLTLAKQAFLTPTLGSCEAAKKVFDTGQGGWPYWRYWHGYQIVSRPVLYFGDMYTLRTVMFLLFSFSAIVLIESIRTYVGSTYSGLTLLSLLSVPLYTALFVADNALVWVLAFLAAAGMLKLARRNKDLFDRFHLHLFLLAGMVTAFVDLLSSPLVALTMPLLVLYWAKAWPEQVQWRPSWAIAIMMSAAWALGYALCWATKWLIVIAVFQGDPAHVTDAMTLRLAGAADWDPNFHPTALMNLKENLGYGRSGFLIIAVLLLLRLGPLLTSSRRLSLPFASLDDALTAGLVFALPFAWIVVLRNHSFVHSFFVCQILVPSFALVLGLIHAATRSPSDKPEAVDHPL